MQPEDLSPSAQGRWIRIGTSWKKIFFLKKKIFPSAEHDLLEMSADFQELVQIKLKKTAETQQNLLTGVYTNNRRTRITDLKKERRKY